MTGVLRQCSRPPCWEVNRKAPSSVVPCLHDPERTSIPYFTVKLAELVFFCTLPARSVALTTTL